MSLSPRQQQIKFEEEVDTVLESAERKVVLRGSAMEIKLDQLKMFLTDLIAIRKAAAK